MKFSSTQMMSALLALALAAPVGALAQTTTKPMAATAGHSADNERSHVEQRIADMYATLHITKAQDTQWNEFAQVMLDNAQSMDATVRANTGNDVTRNADQRMQAYAALADQHARNVDKLSGEFTKLYAALSPDQKKSADEMFAASAAKREHHEKMQKQGG